MSLSLDSHNYDASFSASSFDSKPPLQISLHQHPNSSKQTTSTSISTLRHILDKKRYFHVLHRLAAYGDLVQLRQHLYPSSSGGEPLNPSTTTLDLNVQDHAGNTPSHWAIRNGQIEALSVLLRAGANVNAMNRDGDTLLLAACRCRDDRNLEIVRLLIAHNASPHLHNVREETPLHYAVVNQNHKISEILLENGASPNAAESEGETVIFWAIREGFSAILPTLFKYNVDLNSRNTDSETPLHFASCLDELHCVRLIVDHAKTNCKDFDINALDDEDQTPLECAIANRCHQVVEFLEKQGAVTRSKRPRLQ